MLLALIKFALNTSLFHIISEFRRYSFCFVWPSAILFLLLWFHDK